MLNIFHDRFFSLFKWEIYMEVLQTQGKKFEYIKEDDYEKKVFLNNLIVHISTKNNYR